MHSVDQLASMDAAALRDLAASLLDKVSRLSGENRLKQLKIDQLTHEMAILKRWKFAARSEQLASAQKTLFEETMDADLEAIGLELEALGGVQAKAEPKEQPRRTALPADLPRREIRHEPESTICACGCAMKRIGEDVAEKLDYTPGSFTVERHVRGKWACSKCETLIQAPVPAHVIDKGIPTAGLLAQVLVLSRAGINRPGGVGIYRPGRRLPRSVPRGLRSVGHFAADFGARSGIFFGAGPTFGSR